MDDNPQIILIYIMQINAILSCTDSQDLTSIYFGELNDLICVSGEDSKHVSSTSLCFSSAAASDEDFCASKKTWIGVFQLIIDYK